MDLNNEAILKQKQSLSPAVLESLRILSLSVIDLMNFLNEERNDNPLLELDDSPQYLTFRRRKSDIRYSSAAGKCHRRIIIIPD
ncbi:MAG: hypothetical protein LUD41_05790 [Phascolarctobacterium sp.]|nr:hypothetical protein [Phascolarctobacterium sp.]